MAAWYGAIARNMYCGWQNAGNTKSSNLEKGAKFAMKFGEPMRWGPWESNIGIRCRVHSISLLLQSRIGMITALAPWYWARGDASYNSSRALLPLSAGSNPQEWIEITVYNTTLMMEWDIRYPAVFRPATCILWRSYIALCWNPKVLLPATGQKWNLQLLPPVWTTCHFVHETRVRVGEAIPYT